MRGTCSNLHGRCNGWFRAPGTWWNFNGPRPGSAYPPSYHFLLFLVSTTLLDSRRHLLLPPPPPPPLPLPLLQVAGVPADSVDLYNRRRLSLSFSFFPFDLVLLLFYIPDLDRR